MNKYAPETWPLLPLSATRLEVIRRLYLQVRENPFKPLIAHSVYVRDVGDLLAEVERLRAGEHMVKESGGNGDIL